MEIKIVSRWDSTKVLLCGKYESIKDCLEKNRGAYLRGAYLVGADLRDANLGDANLRDANLGDANLRDANLGDANLRDANLVGADLGGADLGGAYLRGANLVGANLVGADLVDAKNYTDSHNFFVEIIRRQKVETFTTEEWSAIGQIYVHKLCWDSIKKRFDKIAMSISKKCAEVGFNEWEKKFAEIKDE